VSGLPRIAQLTKGLKFHIGQHVKVVQDLEDPEPKPEWVGATGRITAIKDWCYIVEIHEDSINPNPDDGSNAWFTEDELEELNVLEDQQIYTAAAMLRAYNAVLGKSISVVAIVDNLKGYTNHDNTDRLYDVIVDHTDHIDELVQAIYDAAIPL
jgi:hypothetical protein